MKLLGSSTRSNPTDRSPLSDLGIGVGVMVLFSSFGILGNALVLTTDPLSAVSGFLVSVLALAAGGFLATREQRRSPMVRGLVIALIGALAHVGMLIAFDGVLFDIYDSAGVWGFAPFYLLFGFGGAAIARGVFARRWDSPKAGRKRRPPDQ